MSADRDFSIHGNKMVRNDLKYALSPEVLANTLINFQEDLPGFSIGNLIELLKVKALYEIAACIIDAPEFIFHELSLNERVIDAVDILGAISDSLCRIADTLEGEERGE